MLVAFLLVQAENIIEVKTSSHLFLLRNCKHVSNREKKGNERHSKIRRRVFEHASYVLVKR